MDMSFGKKEFKPGNHLVVYVRILGGICALGFTLQLLYGILCYSTL